MRKFIALALVLLFAVGVAQEPTVFELMATIDAPQGSVSEREYLAEKFAYMVPKIDAYCPDLVGNTQVGGLAAALWNGLRDAGIDETLDAITATILDLSGAIDTLAGDHRDPEHNCVWMVGFMYLLITEEGVPLINTFSTIYDYLYELY